MQGLEIAFGERPSPSLSKVGSEFSILSFPKCLPIKEILVPKYLDPIVSGVKYVGHGCVEDYLRFVFRGQDKFQGLANPCGVDWRLRSPLIDQNSVPRD